MQADGTEVEAEELPEGDSLSESDGAVGAPTAHQPLRGLTAASGVGRARARAPGSSPAARASATAAQRSVAVNAPTNAARTTPSPSATTVVGIAAIS